MVNQVDVALSALAEPTRRHVVELLRVRPHRAGELANAVAMSGPAMSRHLRVLRASGLVEVEPDTSARDARLRVYRLRREPFESLSAWLAQIQAVWVDQLNAFKRYVERTEPPNVPNPTASPPHEERP